MSETIVLKVGMSCQGCAGAVQRVLEKMEGVESFDIDLKEQKVIVKGNIQPETVLQTVSKTGKKTSFWETEPPTELKQTEAEVKVTEDEVKATETSVEETSTGTTQEIKPAEVEPEIKAPEVVTSA